MTHKPPVPQASVSPYPLHPAPIVEKAAPIPTRPSEAPKKELGRSGAILSIGAAVGLGAALAGLFYSRRRRPAATPPAKRARRGDDKRKRGAGDRSRVAAGEPYEVAYFARKHGIGSAEARSIIKEAGSDRKAANALAERRKQA
ncbi:DUF3606 domain-containing protein [Sphingomonas sp. BIUV-7]|uniref:DUF3606 domain-containing protein n=1 Tax=Sphingomonas natans TaxID=3063330 RepID=A0ABT8Y9C3_9SPHN|nr:DUF3606 domain-containing protein [Sphingomonas sp. BIUV-7]MDO6414934.1 DUF3606 domain-containing protein [Sphingomonas sp. BIUV-7]